MIARASAVVSVGVLFVAGCAYGVEPGFDESVPGKADAGKDSGVHPVPDASPGKDASDTADTSPELPDTSVACMAMMTTGIPMCDSCMTQNCCAQDNACALSADCANVVGCYSACPADGGVPDGTCIASCDSTYPTGASLLNAWGTCMQTSCGSSCR